MSPYTPPQTPSQPSERFSKSRAALVLILTVAVAASSILMIGPQIILIVPVVLVLGLVFALRRSYWSLVCLGYPFSFGLISAWIGYKEMPGYEQTTPFVVSVCIGLVGCALIVMGLWMALPGSDRKNVTHSQ